jgi:hypothetical protein
LSFQNGAALACLRGQAAVGLNPFYVILPDWSGKVKFWTEIHNSNVGLPSGSKIPTVGLTTFLKMEGKNPLFFRFFLQPLHARNLEPLQEKKRKKLRKK